MSGVTTIVATLDRQYLPEYAELIDWLGRADGRLVYVRNPGNWGDALVHAGARQLLEGVRGEVLVLDEAEVAGANWEDAVLVVAGAGSWTASDHSARDLVERLGPRFARTVVLPTTFELGPAGLDPATVTYFRRDHDRSRRAVPTATFAPDLAFYLRAEVEIAEPAREVRSFGPPGDAPWHCPGHADPSAFGTSASSVGEFLRAVGAATDVRTDRLHVAIGAALLGRRVELYGEPGGKAHAVFKASLADYPGATFVAETDVRPSSSGTRR